MRDDLFKQSMEALKFVYLIALLVGFVGGLCLAYVVFVGVCLRV